VSNGSVAISWKLLPGSQWMLPAATGKGAPLFPELDQPVRLRLVNSTAFPSGILGLMYAPADK
jgi:hypothetical protein